MTTTVVIINLMYKGERKMSKCFDYNIDDCIKYKVNEKAGTVTAYATVPINSFVAYKEKEMNANFSDIVFSDICDECCMIKVNGVARLKCGDTFDVEVGKRIARLKLLRQLNKQQKLYYKACVAELRKELKRVEKCVAHKQAVLDHLNTYIKRECETPYKSKADGAGTSAE